MTWQPSVEACDDYLDQRTGHYDYRRIRYNATVEAMAGLDNRDTVIDVGAGWTEFDYCLRAEHDWRGRYIPVDGGIDGTDLNTWTPPRPAEWFVALEIIEHVRDPFRLLGLMQRYATKGVVLSTPNPRTTDVLGMDPTHVRAVHRWELTASGFAVLECNFYGQPSDSLFAYWLKPR